MALGVLAAAPALLCMGVFAFFYFPIRHYLGVGCPRFASAAWDFVRQVPDLLHGRWSVLDLPLLDGYRHGPGEHYFTIPFVLLMGHTPAAMLWREGVYACLVILATHQLGRVLYRDRWAAFMAALIMTTSPGFILYGIFGSTTGMTQAALAPASLYFFLRYADERKTWLACLGSACLGLALDCRSTMAAFILGLVVYVCLDLRAAAALIPPQPARRWRLMLGCFFSFFVFMLTFAKTWITQPAAFLSYWAGHLAQREGGIGNNLNYWNNLMLRLHQMSWLLKGQDYLHIFVEDPGRYPESSQWFLALAASGSAIYAIFLHFRRKALPRRWALPWVVSIVYLLASPFTPTAMRVIHLFPLLPFICLVSSSAIALASSRFRAPVIALFLLFAASRVRTEFLFFREFYAEVARVGVWEPNLSSAALDLASWFSRRPDAVPVVFHGPAYTLSYLSGGKTRVRILSEALDLPAPESRKAWDEVLRVEDAFFVVGADPHDDFDAARGFPALKLEAARRGLVVNRVDEIDRPDGRAAFTIYQAGRTLRPSRS